MTNATTLSEDTESAEEIQGTPRLAHEIVGDVKAIVSEAATVARKAVRGKPLDDDLATLRAQYEVTREHVAELYDRTRMTASERARQADEAIRTHPYQAMAVAAGLGLLAGLAISRSRRHY